MNGAVAISYNLPILVSGFNIYYLIHYYISVKK